MKRIIELLIISSVGLFIILVVPYIFAIDLGFYNYGNLDKSVQYINLVSIPFLTLLTAILLYLSFKEQRIASSELIRNNKEQSFYLHHNEYKYFIDNWVEDINSIKKYRGEAFLKVIVEELNKKLENKTSLLGKQLILDCPKDISDKQLMQLHTESNRDLNDFELFKQKLFAPDYNHRVDIINSLGNGISQMFKYSILEQTGRESFYKTDYKYRRIVYFEAFGELFESRIEFFDSYKRRLIQVLRYLDKYSNFDANQKVFFISYINNISSLNENIIQFYLINSDFITQEEHKLLIKYLELNTLKAQPNKLYLTPPKDFIELEIKNSIEYRRLLLSQQKP